MSKEARLLIERDTVITVSLAGDSQLTMSETDAQELVERIQRALREVPPPIDGPIPGTNLTLHDAHPLWEQHTGLEGHTGPEWDPQADLERAEAFYRYVANKAKVFLDLLIDSPGAMLDVDEICRRSNGVFTSSRSIAGSITGLVKPHGESGRRYPFYWWAGNPTRYGMKPSVAALFHQARTNLGG